MATPHINAKDGAFAKCILLPGDPMRAKYIAENFLENAECVQTVRNMLGFTGTYKGRKISVMGTGMGVPSISIYVNELMREYGIEVACRIGTCGGGSAPLGSVLLAQGCCTTSDLNHYIFPGTYAPVADYDMLRTAYDKAKELGKEVKVGNFLTTDMFYQVAPANLKLFREYGTIATEMEGAALYTIAKKYKAKALVMASVSDGDHGVMSSEDREKSLNDMITLALDTVWEFADEA